MNIIEKKERKIIMLMLLIYMLIGISYSVYKVNKLKRYEIILVSLFWPLVFMFKFIKLVEKVKEENEKYKDE